MLALEQHILKFDVLVNDMVRMRMLKAGRNVEHEPVFFWKMDGGVEGGGGMTSKTVSDGAN